MNKIAQDTSLAYAFHDFENKLEESRGFSDQSEDVGITKTLNDLSKAHDFDEHEAKEPSVLVKKVLPNLHNLYGLSSVFSFLATPLGMIPATKKASDILQRIGYCLDTGAHQLRGVFTKGERVNLGMMVPTATAFLGTVAFSNKSFWGQLTRNLGNLCHLGILKDMLDYAQEFPDTLPKGTKEHIDGLQGKYKSEKSNLANDFLNDWKIAFELTGESLKNPNILKSVFDSLTGKKIQNVPHMQALSSIFLSILGTGSIVSKVLGKENLAWSLNKTMAIFPTFANLIRSRSYSTMKDPDLKAAGKYGEISSWGTLASAALNFKFEDMALALRALFMGVNTMSFRKEAQKIFKNAAEEMMNKNLQQDLEAATI